jgi:Mn2+/Fe2+ NRAMP family transporter
VNSTAVLFVIGIVGTTVAPWQLFFQQSNIVDKRITPRWINYERADTIIGSGVTVVAATLIIATTAFAFRGHPHLFGNFKDGLTVSQGLGATLGHAAGVLFAIILLNASMVGAASVTLASAYAYGDMSGKSGSLNRSFREAKQFYITVAALIAIAAGIVLIPHAPLGLFILAVQALAGIILPVAMVLALLLCNDRAILGPWVNRPWLNVLAGLVVTVLIGMSVILMVTTVFSNVSTSILAAVLGVALVSGLFVGAALARTSVLEERQHDTVRERSERDRWQMPAAALLEPMLLSPGRRAALRFLFVYLILAFALLAYKSIALGFHPK